MNQNLTLNIVLSIFLIAYSNLIIFNSLKYTKTIKTFIEYIKFDEYAIVYINLIMIIFSGLMMLINHMI